MEFSEQDPNREPIVLDGGMAVVAPVIDPTAPDETDLWNLQVRLDSHAILTIGTFPDAMSAVEYYDSATAEAERAMAEIFRHMQSPFN